MLNIKWLLVFCLLWLSGCNALGPPELGPDGKPLPKIYKLKRQNVAQVKFRMLDAVNALRIAKGIQVLEFNSELNDKVNALETILKKYKNAHRVEVVNNKTHAKITKNRTKYKKHIENLHFSYIFSYAILL